MNLIDLLVRDHEKVLALFGSFGSVGANDADERRGILARIHDELEDHAGVEEQLFYPALAARLRERGGAERDVDAAHEEHRLIRDLLAELVELAPDDERYEAKIKVARDLVLRHVEEEEGRLLPEARALMSPQELDALGSRVEADRAELRTEAIATAPPGSEIPPPDDGPPAERTLAEDVMAVGSEPPQTVASDNPILTERSSRRGDSTIRAEGRPERTRKKRRG